MIELLPLGVLVVYLIPFMAAATRNHDATIGILIANLLLGWTGIGWIALLGFALLTPATSRPAAKRRSSEEIRTAMPRILHETFSDR